MTSRAGQNHCDCFCYICGEYKTVNNRKSITDFVRKEFYAYYWNKVRISRQTMGSYVVCKTCVHVWDNGQKDPDSQWDLVNQWFGGSLQIMLTTVTSVL